jgi:hypothetical protein
MFLDHFDKDTLGWLTIYQIYEKFVITGSIMNNHAGHSMCPRSV